MLLLFELLGFFAGSTTSSTAVGGYGAPEGRRTRRWSATINGRRVVGTRARVLDAIRAAAREQVPAGEPSEPIDLSRYTTGLVVSVEPELVPTAKIGGQIAAWAEEARKLERAARVEFERTIKALLVARQAEDEEDLADLMQILEVA
jgi:hypothetical protein